MTQVAVFGAGGKMGRQILEALSGHNTLQLAAALEQAGNALLGTDAGALIGNEANGVCLSSDIQE